MSNTDRHPECHMRTALGNCDPIGGFCTSVNEPICEALHKASRPKGEWIDKGWHGDWQFETDGRGTCWREFECSNCNCSAKYRSPFCPQCGARMKGADDE